MGHGIILAVLIDIAALLIPATAAAGAWTQKDGDGLVIVSGLYSEALDAFDDNGDLQGIPVFQKAEASAYAEYGLTDWLTAIGRTELKTEAAGTGMTLDEARFGLSGLGARARLWQGNGAVVSAEIAGRLPTDLAAERRAGEPDGEIDLRLLAGYGFALGTWSGFVDLQGAYRLRPGAPADEIRADVTLGVRPWPRLLWMAQSFSTLSTDSAGFATDTEHKAEFSLVYDLTEQVSVQLGGLATLAGRNALQERGVITALWFRF